MIPAITGAIHSLGAGGVGSVGSLGSAANVGSSTSSASSASSGGFGGALTNAMNSLETTQANATSAAQGLATGTISDPTQAVTAVEDAQMSMDLASQISNKLITDEQTIFQTTV